MIERIEEEILRKLFKTEKGCPIFQLYLEAGHLPARFSIKRMKLIILKYILTQNENALIQKVFMAQKKDPKLWDWYSDVRKFLNKFVNISDENIKKMPENIFKSLIKKNACKTGLK